MINVFVKADKYLREKFAKIEQKEIKEASETKPVQMHVGQMGNVKIFAKNADKEVDLPPPEKIKQEKKDDLLTQKAEVKADTCWRSDVNCKHKPVVWVREIQFDIKEENAGINHAVVSSGDYVGPIPGFCIGHLIDVSSLAEAVYFSRVEMQWGMRPERWFVIFTDGTKQGGSCLQLDPNQIPTIVKDEYFGQEEERH